MLLNLLIIQLFKLIVTKLGVLQVHVEFVGYQKYLFRTFLFHIVVNQLVIPLFSVSI